MIQKPSNPPESLRAMLPWALKAHKLVKAAHQLAEWQEGLVRIVQSV